MRIAFIGAGKVGVTLGKYLSQLPSMKIAGYYSLHIESARKAADYATTNCFTDLEQLINFCDALFLTVPDGRISQVYEEIKHYNISGKQIIHCSGSLSSDVFYDIEQQNAFGLSIHPLYAFSKPYEDNPMLSQAVITMEGKSASCMEAVSYWKEVFNQLGNSVVVMNKEAKTKYHAAAVLSSNLVLGLLETAVSILEECGFSKEEALQAIKPLTTGNLENAFSTGLSQALTGPVERGDETTVKKHLQEFAKSWGDDEKEQKTDYKDVYEIYRLLSRQALRLAQEKHNDRDYKGIKEILS